MATRGAKAKNEHTKLLAASIDSMKVKTTTVDSSYSEYSSMTYIPKCNFVTAKNKKPLIAIVVLLFIGLAATLTMLYLDHEGFWDTPNPVDNLWFSQTLTNKSHPLGLYPLWFRAATENGENIKNNQSLHLYKSQYGPQWNADTEQTYNYSTLITQSQLIYNFATAFSITRNLTYYKTMTHGIDVILNRFNDSQNGGFVYAINETFVGNHSNVSNVIIDDTKNSIGHSSFMYAISTAFIVTSNNEVAQKELYLNILNYTYDIFQQYFFDDFGGIYGNLTNDWNVLRNDSECKSQQSLMYYFEALSQLLTVAQNIYYTPQYRNLLDLKQIKSDIESIFEFVCSELLQAYFDGQNNKYYYILYERYVSNWTEPLSDSNDVSLGNAYKWAYLISYFLDANVIQTNTDNIPNRDQALAFLAYAIDLGYDKALSKVHDKIAYDKWSNPPYWTVCNALKTLYYYWYDFAEQSNDDWLGVLQSVVTYYQSEYYDIGIGGIYYSKPQQIWKGNVSKVDYQCIDMTLYVTNTAYYK